MTDPPAATSPRGDRPTAPVPGGAARDPDRERGARILPGGDGPARSVPGGLSRTGVSPSPPGVPGTSPR